MRYFETRGPVNPEKNYVVSRTEETVDFIERIKMGRYIVLFAPRQTGKTTFFRRALDKLSTESPKYFPIQLDFQIMRNISSTVFYERLYVMIRDQITTVLRQRDEKTSVELMLFLEQTQLTDSFSMRTFFQQLYNLLENQRIVILIDEFDGIPETVVSDFLYTIRHIYLSDELHCPYSLGIVGVKSITQLNYDRSISPFNIQDDFNLPNFTLEQVHELFSQYTEETGQHLAPDVIEMIHKQTGGQPFLVNRFGQILTDEMEIPKTQTIDVEHFLTAHTQMLEEQNINITHLLTNIRRNPQYKKELMRIASYERGMRFSLDNEFINELATYGVLTRGSDGMCEIVNPIYQHRILQAFRPLFNGLETDYFPEDTYFEDYLTPEGHIDLERLLDNFRDFIARVGFRILQVPDTPQEFVGQDLLYAYLDQFVSIVRGNMYLEVQTGRGRMDLVIFHNSRKYIVETKIWEGGKRFLSGKKQLMTYLNLEQADEGYYVVFDHRQNPMALTETETEDGVTIRSYVIPVVQERPTSAGEKD